MKDYRLLNDIDKFCKDAVQLVDRLERMFDPETDNRAIYESFDHHTADTLIKLRALGRELALARE